jgi:hypothetical protein
MNQRHLSDERLIEMCLSGPGARVAEPHVATCPDCEARRAELARMLDDIAAAAIADADAAFSGERLARQHARIMQQIEQDGRPARVISFPAGQPAEPVVLRTRPASRWVAGAAAAGLALGLLAGHLAHDLPGRSRTAPAPQLVVNEAVPAPPLRPISTAMSDDQLLVEIDMAIGTLGNGGPAALRPLDAVTPRAWEVAAQ